MRIALGLIALAAATHAPISAVQAQTQLTNLTASDAQAGDQFGLSVSAHGDRILVGTPFDDDAGEDSGSAYLFRFVDGRWAEEAKLGASDANAGDEFGIQVALEGEVALIGARGSAGTGAAYVFRYDRRQKTWMEEARLTATDAAPGDEFGRSVAMAGHRVAVGAPRTDGPAPNTGRAYVFERVQKQWVQRAALETPHPSSGGQFGQSVAVSGGTVVVGAWLEDEFGWNAGAVHVYRSAGAGPWLREATLTASDADSGDVLGYAVSIDGDTVVAGALAVDLKQAFDTGAAYVFVRSGGAWAEQAKLTASDPEDFDAFGCAVALEDDTVLIGALVEDDCPTLSFCDTGAAYLFEFDHGVWTEQAKLTASDRNERDEFGVSVALSGETIAVGAFWNDDDGEDSGSVYVFERDSGGCPLVDCDGSGRVDLSDLACFQLLLASGDPRADCNVDGSLNLEDFWCFQQIFQGCR